MLLPAGFVISITASIATGVTGIAAEGLSDDLKKAMMHHALYIEVANGDFKGILDFSKDGLLYNTDLKAIILELKRYKTEPDSQVVPVPFSDSLIWTHIVDAIKEVAHLYYGVMDWNCQDYTNHLIKAAQKSYPK